LNDNDLKLLDKYGVVVLPKDIDHDTYKMMVEVMLHRGPRPLTLYCNGNGGTVGDGNAIIALIQQHGNVTGLLPGEANSCHAMIFASCQHRFIYPNAAFGVHSVAKYNLDTRIDANYLKHELFEYQQLDKQNAALLADVTTMDFDYWYHQITKVSGAVNRFSYDLMIEVGLAESIKAYDFRTSEVTINAYINPYHSLL
jgi:ATP-dependent protease ClpP protease subunit